MSERRVIADRERISEEDIIAFKAKFAELEDRNGVIADIATRTALNHIDSMLETLEVSREEFAENLAQNSDPERTPLQAYAEHVAMWAIGAERGLQESLELPGAHWKSFHSVELYFEANEQLKVEPAHRIGGWPVQ